MLFTVFSNLKQINLPASGEIYLFTFHSWASSHQHIFLQNPKKNLVTPATLRGGYTVQVKTQKGTDGHASLCIHGTHQMQTLCSLFSLLSALEIKSSSRFRFQVTGKHSRMLRLWIKFNNSFVGKVRWETDSLERETQSVHVEC